jgi:hypothetical protein
MLALTTGSALAIPIPGTSDAGQTVIDHALLPQALLAQTFVPTLTGSLGTVEINTSLYSAPLIVQPNAPTDLTVEITTTSSNLPTSTVLATQVVSPADSSWDVVTFSTPTNVVAGTQYAIVVSQSASNGVAEWNGTCGNEYGPGVAYIFNSTWETIPAWNEGDCITDFAFQTFIVVPAATPAPTTAPTAPPTSTMNSAPGDAPSNPGYMLILAGLAVAAAATVFISSRRRVTQR